jgi:hypothetical protein
VCSLTVSGRGWPVAGSGQRFGTLAASAITGVHWTPVSPRVTVADLVAGLPVDGRSFVLTTLLCTPLVTSDYGA